MEKTTKEHREMVRNLRSGIFKMDGIPREVIHSVVGIASESGELTDALKKACFYGREIDYDNIDEEMGDILWYIHNYCIERGITLDDLLRQNLRKLRKRYGDSWSEDAEKDRDLDAERKVLERPKPPPNRDVRDGVQPRKMPENTYVVETVPAPEGTPPKNPLLRFFWEIWG